VRKEVDPVLLPEKIIAALNEDKDAAKWLLLEFHKYVEEMRNKDWSIKDVNTYSAIPPMLLEYLSDCLKLYFRSNAPLPIDKALGLNIGKSADMVSDVLVDKRKDKREIKRKAIERCGYAWKLQFIDGVKRKEGIPMIMEKFKGPKGDLKYNSAKVYWDKKEYQKIGEQYYSLNTELDNLDSIDSDSK